MSFGRKVFTVITLLVAFTALSVISFGQETPAPKTDSADKTKVEGRKGRMGRKGRQGFHGERGKRHGRRGGMIRGLDKLNLTDPQKSQIKTIVETHKVGQQPQHEEMRALRTKFRDGTATEDDKSRMRELRGAGRESAEQLKNSVLGVLTPDQLQQLEQMKAERKQRMEERRQLWKERRHKQPESPTKTDN